MAVNIVMSRFLSTALDTAKRNTLRSFAKVVMDADGLASVKRLRPARSLGLHLE